MAFGSFWLRQKSDRYNSRQNQPNEQEKLRAKWLIRLVCVAAFGFLVVFVYALPQWSKGTFSSVVSLGLMAAGAAWLSGSIMGFLFGIPHSRDNTPNKKQSKKQESIADTIAQEDEEARYKPSTSLEQISDWLTKIIVGVGLTQMQQIPGKLDRFAAYIAAGMGSDASNKPFTLSIFVYFSISGFLFGFLWSRLYMIRAFADAETLRRLEEIKSQLDFDTEARNLVDRQLTPDAFEVPAEQLKAALGKASRATRAALFEKAKEQRNASSGADDIRIRLIPIFQALISLDSINFDHESHAQLATIFRDMGKLEDALAEYNKAIEIRNRLAKRGWTQYELRRALVLMRIEHGTPSTQETRHRVLRDLQTARRDPKRAKDFEDRGNEILSWLEKNNLSFQDIESGNSPPSSS